MGDKTAVVVGQTKENAQKLLDAAKALDLDLAVVRTVDDGFEAPEEVVDKAFGKSEPSDDEPSFSSKAEAEAYADEHKLDIDKSLSAADYKAAVTAAAKGGE